MTMLFLNVFGGLAIFIFGMKLMGDGLHTVAGDRMRGILRFFAANRFVAILSGTFVTAIIQSSSATTVMVIGFVNAGLLNLVQSIGIIFGANIGTTVTAQIVAFKVDYLIMPAIILGLLMSFIPKGSWKGWGETVLGFGFLFLGMGLMSTELKTLADLPAFMNAFATFNCAPVNGWIPLGPLLGAIGIGLVATLIIQSSSACTGIIIALGAGGLIDIYTAVALVLGSNIGTTITAQLAAIPANRIAKQAALAHTLFNVIGVLVISLTFWFRWGDTDVPVFFQLVNYLSGGGGLPRHIANAHTIFNVTATLILVPFIPLLAKICEKIIPLPPKEEVKYEFLEPNLLATPSIALEQAKGALEKMFEKSWHMTDAAVRHFMAGGESPADIAQLNEDEADLDRIQLEITQYLTKLTYQALPSRDAERIPLMIHCVNDAERIGDRTLHILEQAGLLKSNAENLSGTAGKELEMLYGILAGQAADAILALRGKDGNASLRAAEAEKEVIRLSEEYEFNHVERLGRNECTPAIGIIYVELLSELRDISRHISNIAERSGGINRK